MPFNEPQFLKLIFSLADTQQWLDGIIKETLSQLPEIKSRKLMQQDYYLSITALAHILERHYYKIPRHPAAGKFHMEIVEILHCIREAKSIPPIPVAGCNNRQRIIHTAQPVGFDQNGQSTSTVTIITNQAGNIITAFPGTLHAVSIQSVQEVQCPAPKEQAG